MYAKKLILFAVILLVLPACLAGPSAEDLAKTMVAQTAVAAPPTGTATAAATDTQLPPTVPAATATSAFTPTPSGPLVIKDDFTTKSAIWGPCSHCEWKDNKLYFGPFPANGDKAIDQLHYLVCVACGQHTFFRVSADIAFSAGQAGDRYYGIGSIIPDQYLATAGITPYQYGTLEIVDIQAGKYLGSGDQRFGAVKAGGAVNHLELDARPDPSGKIDYYVIVNGKNIIFRVGLPARSTQAALYFDWHSVGVTVDNFEFDEIVP